MEIHYHKWLELKILHQYFSDGKIPISLVPAQGTAMIMKRNNILIREIDGVFEFYIGLDSVNIDQASLIENFENLEFEINIEDQLFFNYTDLSPINSEEYYLFRNLLNSSDLLIEKASSEALEGQLKDNSIGILKINVSDLQTESLTLSFDTRKVFYEYQILFSTHSNWEIIDLKVYGYENEEFFGPIEKTIVGGQKAQVFMSPNPMPLLQIPIIHPELKLQYNKHGSSNIKELEMKLPNVSPENLSYNEDDRLVSFAIVYV